MLRLVDHGVLRNKIDSKRKILFPIQLTIHDLALNEISDIKFQLFNNIDEISPCIKKFYLILYLGFTS